MSTAQLDPRVSSVLSRLQSSYQTRTVLQEGVKAASKVYERRMQALELFRPFTYQDQFLTCDATEVLVQGGTRSGKSTVIAACIAAYALDKSVYTSYGLPIPMRPVQFRGVTTGEIWVIGKQSNHASTIYRLLFKPGLFTIIRDPVTRQWRALRPGVIPGDDQIPRSEWKPSPPLIYAGQCEFDWESKKAEEFKKAILPNGWKICFYPSSGQPKRGDPVHRIWIDEEIEGEVNYYSELQSRLSDYQGRIWWSSWPDISCAPLMALRDRCDADQAKVVRGEKPKADFVRMRFRGSDNPMIDENQKRLRTEGWDDATRRARDEGEFVIDTIQTYPEFSAALHAVDYGLDNPLNDKITEILRMRNWVPPADWRVDLILDPGTQSPGILWGAIPPPGLWHRPDSPVYVIYRELTGRYNAKQLALMVKTLEPGRQYCQFVIDGKAGDQTSMGAELSVMQLYSAAFREQGLRCQLTADMFMPGSPSWITRSMKLRSWMATSAEGRPQLRIVTHMCRELIRQLSNNVRKVSKEDIQDKPAPGQKQDLMVCLEYWASLDPSYVAPPAGGTILESPAYLRAVGEADWFNSLTSRPQQQKGSNPKVICGIP